MTYSLELDDSWRKFSITLATFSYAAHLFSFLSDPLDFFFDALIILFL